MSQARCQKEWQPWLLFSPKILNFAQIWMKLKYLEEVAQENRFRKGKAFASGCGKVKTSKGFTP